MVRVQQKKFLGQQSLKLFCFFFQHQVQIWILENIFLIDLSLNLFFFFLANACRQIVFEKPHANFCKKRL